MITCDRPRHRARLQATCCPQVVLMGPETRPCAPFAWLCVSVWSFSFVRLDFNNQDVGEERGQVLRLCLGFSDVSSPQAQPVWSEQNYHEVVVCSQFVMLRMGYPWLMLFLPSLAVTKDFGLFLVESDI